jgi:CBS domain-containing protein
MHLADYDHMPSVGAAMTPFPYSVGPDASVLDVEHMMNTHRIRHVPVLEEGRVLGVVSERDLHHRPRRCPRPTRPRLASASSPHPAGQRHAVDEVASRWRSGTSARRCPARKLAGIFSTVDACRLLAEFLCDRFPDGPEAA